MAVNYQVVGLQGRVTGTVGPGLVGEVMVHGPAHGEAEVFLAHPTVPDARLPVGTQVVVQDYEPPRTVHVAPFFVDPSV